MSEQKIKKLKSILLVDDDKITNFINQTLISKLNITETVVVKNNGLQALQYIKSECPQNNCPDLILLDINMPVMNGFEFLEILRHAEIAHKSKIKIAILSSTINPADLLKIKTYGVDHISKPMLRKDLLSLLEKYSED